MRAASWLRPAALGAALFAAAAPLEAASFGLVVGIDKYQKLISLDGAANDAATSLRRSRNRVRRCRPAARRRSLPGRDSRRLGPDRRRGQLGDTVVFSYAGHGGQERERLKGDETDGLNEVFLLPAFEEKAPGNGDRILDDEIYALFDAARMTSFSSPTPAIPAP